MSGHTVTDEDWETALRCAMSCLHDVAITKPQLDNAMQHAFGLLSLRKTAVTNSHADLVRALEEIAAIEPVEGKAAKNRGAMVHMQSIARAALATLTARKVG